MEKSNSRTLSNSLQTQSDSESRKVLAEQELNRISNEVKRDKSEICVSAKEKTPDLNSQGNGQRHFADVVKFGQFYGPIPPQYFDQFSGMRIILPCRRVVCMSRFLSNTHPICT